MRSAAAVAGAAVGVGAAAAGARSMLVPVFIDRGRAVKGSLAALSVAAARAAELGAVADAVVAGEDLPDELLHGLGRYGADRVWRLRGDARLAGVWVDLLSERLSSDAYGYVVLAGGPLGLAVAGGVAGRCRGAVVTDAVGLRVEGDSVVVERSVFRGGQVADARLRRGPGVIVAQPGALRIGELRDRDAQIIEVTVVDRDAGSAGAIAAGRDAGSAGAIAAGRDAGCAGAIEVLQSAGVDDPGRELALADVVVTGGRGLGEAGGFALIEGLAEVLGRRIGESAVGATRAVVDAGWRDGSAQVGLTGRTVAPRLYVAVGVSGAPQHRAGMEGSEHILAINSDPRAPIFGFADLGVVADLYVLVPALTQRLSGRNSAEGRGVIESRRSGCADSEERT